MELSLSPHLNPRLVCVSCLLLSVVSTWTTVLPIDSGLSVKETWALLPKAYFPYIWLDFEYICSKSGWFWRGRQLKPDSTQPNLYSTCAVSKMVNHSKPKIHPPTSQQIPALEILVSQEESLFWGMIYIHMAWVLPVEIWISRVKCVSWLLRSLYVSNCAPNLEATGVLGAAENSCCVRLPRKHYFNSTGLTHLMGRLPTGPSCLPTLPHLLRFFCEIKMLDTWILPKTKQN